MICCFDGWLVEMMVCWINGWLVGLLDKGRFKGRLVNDLVGLNFWIIVGWMVCWLVGFQTCGWFDDFLRSVGFLVGWLGCLSWLYG